MNTNIDQKFVDDFTRGCTDSMFIPVLKDVRKDFLTKTNTNMVTGQPFLILCLLLVQSMETMSAGYSGSSTISYNSLYEAVGIGAVAESIRVDSDGVVVHDRYRLLVTTIINLLQINTEFKKNVDEFLNWDMHNPISSEKQQ